MVEGARLESVFRGNSNVGSNPTLSASSFLWVTASSEDLRNINGGLRVHSRLVKPDETRIGMTRQRRIRWRVYDVDLTARESR